MVQWYGEKYYALNFEFGRGAYQAGVHNENDGWIYNFQECNLDDPIPNTVGATFTDLDHKIAFLDLRTAKDDPHLQEWLDRETRLHCTGNAYDPEHPKKTRPAIRTGEAFDGLCYIDKTSGTHLLRHD